ncbi:primosomal protein N' [Rhodoferax lacus]|uniref:Replication restart protein PriA n=1 Tax=Rhodoferax lacus TaxID=2184758 RepID=A0A3E1R6H7_9BURK|nr:primosomal protein N' [Rhodoferax lacus]RFO94944.1 primosomal protein N' [Rhodoferax lacus]
MNTRLCVLVQTPAHSALGPVLTYRSPQALAPGTLVRVPLGSRETLGIVWEAGVTEATGEIDPDKVRDIAGTLEGIAPLGAAWQQLVGFAAQYYQRSVGEVALAALPPQLRDLSPLQMQRRLKRKKTADSLGAPVQAAQALSPEQAEVLAQIQSQSGPFLLFGATGSGKTEVYLHAVAAQLAADPAAQALVMVPEINLTPQLEARFMARFGPVYGEQAVVSLHSGMTNPQRLKSWLAAHSGQARIVLGTRMAVFASLPCLRLIVVDEEHDPSYKSSEGARYSARDLAVYRGKLEGAKVILGSATPSLESWYQSRPSAEGGRYLRLHMPSRIGSLAMPDAGTAQDTGSAGTDSATFTAHAASPDQGARNAMRRQSGTPDGLPLVRRVDMNHQPRRAVFSLPLLEAIKERVARGEQCMVFLNRRGYAPVLHCADCGWKSECPHCSAFRVFHKIDRTLRCHHCGFTERVPRACPACGNPDIEPMGRGTEQLEEQLGALLADVRRPGTESAEHPEGLPLRIARIDADSTRLKGALETQLAAVHAGEVDVLVGTQMIAKGHDFRRITLVAAVNPDGALFSSDFRAPERLFSLLMQAAGRSGRDAALGDRSEVWIQTFQPAHPLYAALKAHDYPAFAEQQLQERQKAGMPPFSAQALVRAEARTQEAAQAFLNLARQSALTDMAQWPGWEVILEQVFVYPAVPMSIQRVANVERAQMLVESPSRAALQKFLAAWHDVLHGTRAAPECKGLIRWAVDVDPLAI